MWRVYTYDRQNAIASYPHPYASGGIAKNDTVEIKVTCAAAKGVISIQRGRVEAFHSGGNNQDERSGRLSGNF